MTEEIGGRRLIHGQAKIVPPTTKTRRTRRRLYGKVVDNIRDVPYEFRLKPYVLFSKMLMSSPYFVDDPGSTDYSTEWGMITSLF